MEIAALTDRLIKYRTIPILDEISGETVDKIYSQLLELQLESETEPVKLVITSGGGATSAALALCDFMNHFFTVPVHGIAIGACHSAATFILASCSVRKCTPNTTFVIHSNTAEAPFRVDNKLEERMHGFLCETRTLASLVVAHYVRTLGIEAERARELITRGDQEFNNALSAVEAKEIGLVQEIIDGKLDIFPHT